VVSFSPKAKRKAGKRTSGKDGRGKALEDAGMRLLARYDYDQVSMAQIAREAGCSVGAFYGRYRNKEAYLCNLVGSAFHTLTQYAREDLRESPDRSRSAQFIARMIVDHVVSRMTADKVAGVVRATMKLATVKPLAIESFENYRESVAIWAIALLAQTSNTSPPRQIRAAVQIVIATVTDAILQKKPGPLVVDSPALNKALYAVLAGYLGLGPQLRWARDDDSEDDGPVAAVKGTEEPSTLPEGHVALYDPDMRTFQGTALLGTERTRKAAIKKGSQSKAQSKGNAGQNSNKAKADPSKSVTVKPPRVPACAVNNAPNKRKNPRPRIV
jgi:AcrR family transcriptional regulator